MGGIRTRNRSHEPRKRPTQARSRATVAAIVEGAAQVFDKLGYAETTTDLVAQRAGVSIGSLYQYFPDKDAILVALFEHHIEHVDAQFAELAQMLEDRVPAQHVVRETVTRLFAMHRDQPRLHLGYTGSSSRTRRFPPGCWRPTPASKAAFVPRGWRTSALAWPTPSSSP